jgi:hypothetical protein
MMSMNRHKSPSSRYRLVLGMLVAIGWIQCGVEAAKIPVVKEHADCDSWASQGECVNNPRFMWQSCHARCVVFCVCVYQCA